VLLLQHVRWRGRRLSTTRFTCRLQRPLLAPWYRLVADGERLLLEHGRSVVCFEGAAVRALLPALLPLLDGAHTVAEIIATAGEAVRPAVERALELLETNGLLVEGPPATLPAANMLAAAIGVAPAGAERRLAEAVVGVVGAAGTAERVARLLAASGIGRVARIGWDGGAEVDFAVVAPEPAEAPLLGAWNATALERGRCWLPVRPFDGLVCTVGPLVVPGESACFECLLLRMAGHLEYGGDVRRVEAVPVAAPPVAPLEALVAGVASQLVLGWTGGPDLTLPGLLYVLETKPSLALASHTVLRVPRCPVCSDVARTAPPLPWHPAVLPAELPA